MSEDKSEEISKEDIKLALEENIYMQEVLKIMNEISLKDETEQDYEKLWNNVSLGKKVTSVHYKPELAVLYYNILASGYANFGQEFFVKMIKCNPEYLVEAAIIFLQQLEQNSEYIEKLEEKLKTLEK